MKGGSVPSSLTVDQRLDCMVSTVWSRSTLATT